MSRLHQIVEVSAAFLLAGLLFAAPAKAATYNVVATSTTDLWTGAYVDPSESLDNAGYWVSRPDVYGSEVNQFRSPWDTSGKDITKIGYWSIGNTSAENLPNPGVLDFGTNAQNHIEFLWGSVDSYNKITFLDGAGGVLFELLGSALLGPGSNVPSGTGAALIEFFVDGFTKIEFRSTSNAFELSNIKLADAAVPTVPLPPAVLLLGSVIGGLGMFGAMRRKAQSAA